MSEFFFFHVWTGFNLSASFLAFTVSLTKEVLIAQVCFLFDVKAFLTGFGGCEVVGIEQEMVWLRLKVADARSFVEVPLLQQCETSCESDSRWG